MFISSKNFSLILFLFLISGISEAECSLKSILDIEPEKREWVNEAR